MKGKEQEPTIAKASKNSQYKHQKKYKNKNQKPKSTNLHNQCSHKLSYLFRQGIYAYSAACRHEHDFPSKYVFYNHMTEI